MPNNRYKQAKRVTLISASLNAFLGIIKLIGGAFFQSQALIADGFHSLSDLATDATVIFASKYGSQDADESHPYGHQRFETAATLLLALFLILAGFGIGADALYDLYTKSWEKPGWWALPIALFSLLSNELLFHYTHYVGKKIQSTLLLANAWHHRSDAASSLVVALGLVGSLSGFTYLDTIAAVVVSGMIVKMGLHYGWDSVKELVDTAVSPQSLQEITNLIYSFEEVKKIHQLRTRSMSGDILMDVHILVAPTISVSEGHFIAERVHRALVKHFPRMRDVMVHVDPEDDEKSCPSINLPDRQTLEKNLLHPCQKDFPDISGWTLHYLEGKIQIELFVREHSTRLELLYKRLERELGNFPEIASIRVYSELRRL